jgi:PST family polysaccharide transporter
MSKNFYTELKWSVMIEVAVRLFAPLSYILLAKILTPDDFGIASVGFITISFLRSFWENSVAKAIVRSNDNSFELENLLFWVSLIFSISIFLMIYLFRNFIAIVVFNDDRLVEMLQIQGLQIILGGLTVIPMGVFQRRMLFRAIFNSQFIMSITTTVVSIALAANGLGYMSMVYGAIIGQCLQVLTLWYQCDWRPKSSSMFDFKSDENIANFILWSSFEGIVSWIYLWMDSLVVGSILGASILGAYRLSSLITISAFSICVSPIAPVLFSKISSEFNSNGVKGVDQIFLKVQQATFALSLPLGLLLFVSSQYCEFFFGNEWSSMVIIIQFLALSNAITWITGMNDNIFKAIGRPEIQAKVQLFKMTYHLIGYLMFSKFGLYALLCFKLAASIVDVAIDFLVQKIEFHISYSDSVLNVKLVVFCALIYMTIYLLFKRINFFVGIGPLNAIPLILIYFSSVMASYLLIMKNSLVVENFKRFFK